MIPKESLIIIGGAEERDEKFTDMEERNKLYEKHEILHELIPQKGETGKIEIITTASIITLALTILTLKYKIKS